MNFLEQLEKIFQDNLYEGKTAELAAKAGNWAETIGGVATKIGAALKNPVKILDFFKRNGAMSKSEFKEFAQAYVDIYSDMPQSFINQHEEEFKTINDIVMPIIDSMGLNIKISAKAEKKLKSDTKEIDHDLIPQHEN